MSQRIPRNGPAREALRQKGQFWTPDWVARAMVRYLLEIRPRAVFDPAVGAGAFLKAAKEVASSLRQRIALEGMELDHSVLEQAGANGLSDGELACIKVGDFVLDPPHAELEAVVANPPYIRHHRIPRETKEELASLAIRQVGKKLDGRAGLHVYFLIRALSLLRSGGRLAFILPADVCEGVFARDLWSWVASSYRIDAVVTFSSSATPFPGVDTNPIVVFIENSPSVPEFAWARIDDCNGRTFEAWVESGFHMRTEAVSTTKRKLAEGLRTGLSRPEDDLPHEEVCRLGDVVSVQRGIATGDNSFFFLTRQEAHELGLGETFLVPAVGRTRDIPGPEITEETVRQLEVAGRPTLLFAPDGRPIGQFPAHVQRYLQEGVRRGLPDRPLIRTRKPWYKMEQRTPPPFLFAYLGRRHVRFIRNLAGVVPLTCFLCVYLRPKFRSRSEAVWRLLCSEALLSRLPSVAKSYGGGAMKIEPRALESLCLPRQALEESGIAPEDLAGEPLLPFPGLAAK